MTRGPSETSAPLATGPVAIAVAIAVALAVQPAAAAASSVATAGQPAVSGPTPSPADVGPGDDDTGVTLEESVLVQQRGDVVELTFEFHGRAREARVRLGSADRVGFEARFAIRDGDGDGTVVVRWNTAASDEAGGGLSIEGGSGWGGDGFVRGPRVVEAVPEPVEPAEYPVSVVWSATGTETDLGRVVVEERSTHRLTVHSVPARLRDAEDVDPADYVPLPPDDTVAVGDHARDLVVLRLDASGLAGQIEDAADFDGGVDGLALTVEEADATVEPNEDPVRLRLAGNATLLAAGARDRYYLVFSAEALLAAGAEVGDRFVATFSADETNPATASNESVTATFELVDGRASVDLTAGELLAGPTEGARITGTSTWAPGTELLVQVYVAGVPGNGSSFVGQSEVVVEPDGTWTATFDLSGQVPGQEADVAVFQRNTEVLLADASGELGNLSASVRFDSQVVQDDGTLVVVESVTLAQGGFVAIHEGGPTGPVVGTSDYLAAGSHGDVRIRLDANATVENETTLHAVAHLDADGNRQFGYVVTGGAVDGPYVADGSPVAARAVVFVESPLQSDAQQSLASPPAGAVVPPATTRPPATADPATPSAGPTARSATAGSTAPPATTWPNHRALPPADPRAGQ